MIGHHIDLNRDNNSWINLREATRSENEGNKPCRSDDNKTGYKGVHFHKHQQKYCATITKNGKRIHLGYFNDPKVAHEAYKNASNKIFNEFARAA